jgi:subtilisin family serine protease
MFKTAVIAAAAASASAAELRRAPVGSIIQGEYIVALHGGSGGEDLGARVQELRERLGGDMTTKHVYASLASHGFSAFSARLSPAGLAVLAGLESVAYLEENQEVHINDCKVQSDPDWGTTRTNIRGNYESSDTTYDYTSGASGSGVDAYIIDTGIYCGNNDFTKLEGTCVCGVDYVDGSCVDGNGHGTHCAGTVAGQTYGVAKEANLIAVRVLNDAGSGSLDDVIAGIEWAVGNMNSSGKPSVANLSLGSSYSSSVNDATTSAVSAGLNMMVAAGNDNANACNYSPASAGSAVTVGATDKKDARASYSNYGKCLDLFGPGSDITSAWIGSPNATNTISGTSMATPQVCGVAAKYLSADPSMTTSEVAAKLVADATANVLTGVNGGFNPNNADNKSPNLMVYGYCT